jgi:flagellar protein FliO/FliZ
MRARVVPIAASLSLSLLAAWAAGAAEPAPPPAVSALSTGSLAQVVLALILVLGVIVAFAWLLRRFVPGQVLSGGVLRVVGGVMVGPRERLVVVEVGETWLLLGVAANQVTLVHSMPRPALAPASSGAEQRSFARLLGQVLAARREER